MRPPATLCQHSGLVAPGECHTVEELFFCDGWFVFQSGRVEEAFVLKRVFVNQSHVERSKAGSLILCRNVPVAPSAKFFISKFPYGEYTTAG